MINISPMEEFYLKELLRNKPRNEIAKENNIYPTSISICLQRLKKRTNLNKTQLLRAVIQNDYNVVFRGKNYKTHEQIFNETESVIGLRKLRFTNAEIIKELKEKI